MSAPIEVTTVIDQLGGRRIFAMAFSGCSYQNAPVEVTLRVAPALVRHARGKATHVRIVLAPDDTYTVEIWRVRGLAIKVLECLETVYADSLREVVERATGLSLTLGTMGARA